MKLRNNKFGIIITFNNREIPYSLKTELPWGLTFKKIFFYEFGYFKALNEYTYIKIKAVWI